MKYEVQEPYSNDEFEFELLPGDILFDGDIEPDLMAELQFKGIVVPEFYRRVPTHGLDKTIEPKEENE